MHNMWRCVNHTYCIVAESFWIPQKIIDMQEEWKTWKKAAPFWKTRNDVWAISKNNLSGIWKSFQTGGGFLLICRCVSALMRCCCHRYCDTVMIIVTIKTIVTFIVFTACSVIQFLSGMKNTFISINTSARENWWHDNVSSKKPYLRKLLTRK